MSSLAVFQRLDRDRIGITRVSPNWWSGLALLAYLAMPSASLAADTSASEAGFYVFMNHVALKNFDDVYTTALSQDYVDGAAIMLEWKAFEPQPDVYDWSDLDRWVEKAVTLHKKLSIGVVGGWFTPDWLYGSGYGVPKNSFNYDRSRRESACTILTLPSFWHPVYLREYGKMMAALSQHLRGLQGPGLPSGAVYKALRVVKLSGINNTTEELRVDATKPDNGPCQQSDAAAIWAQAGFTPDKVIAAWKTIAEDTAKAFPDKILSVDVIHRGAFPSIDNGGRVVPPTRDAPDDLTEKILNIAVPMYRDRLMVQWDALWQGKPPQEVLDSGAHGARIGWQMNGFMGVWGGSGCVYKPFHTAACNNLADFQSILDNGINYGGRYIEIHAPNANTDFAPAFQAAHSRLLR
jgi:hypothetical protein